MVLFYFRLICHFWLGGFEVLVGKILLIFALFDRGGL